MIYSIHGYLLLLLLLLEDCEHLLRNMLATDPVRRYSTNQVLNHRWLNRWVNTDGDEDENHQAIVNIHPPVQEGAAAAAVNLLQEGAANMMDGDEAMANFNPNPNANPPHIALIANLDTVVLGNMLQFNGLTADKIAQSVHENRYDSIYAMYFLLLDKLKLRRRDQRRLQQYANRIR